MTEDCYRIVGTSSTEKYNLIVRQADGDTFKMFREYHDPVMYCANADAPALIVAIMEVSGCTLNQIQRFYRGEAQP